MCMNNSIQAYLELTVRKLKMSNKLHLNLFKTVLSHVKIKSRKVMSSQICRENFRIFFGMKPQVSPLKADFHSVQFIERAEFCDHFLLKCVQSAISNEIRST